MCSSNGTNEVKESLHLNERERAGDGRQNETEERA